MGGGGVTAPQHDLAGYGARYAFAVFVLWAASRRDFPMPEDVIARFSVSRPTAHTWLTDYEQASGRARPRRNAWTKRKAAA
jgi:hypothetical protein